VSQAGPAAECVKATSREFGAMGVLVHCAGGTAPSSLLKVTPEVWCWAFDTDVHAIFHLCRAAVPLMQKRHAGAIVLISFGAGLRGCVSAIFYRVAKGALLQFASWSGITFASTAFLRESKFCPAYE